MPYPPDTATAFSWTGAVPSAMSIYRENRGYGLWAMGYGLWVFGLFSSPGRRPLPSAMKMNPHQELSILID